MGEEIKEFSIPPSIPWPTLPPRLRKDVKHVKIVVVEVEGDREKVIGQHHTNEEESVDIMIRRSDGSPRTLDTYPQEFHWEDINKGDGRC